MIKEITERFPLQPNGKPYATLEKATVNLNDMGEKTITTQVSVDGQVVPDFSQDWELEFKGEKYIMPLRKPQASKANDSLSSKIDLTFQHWAQYQLKRYYFVTLQSEVAGVAVADKYIASVSLNLKNFCNLFGQLLEYYYGDAITIDLNENWESTDEPIYVDVNYSYMWDVLIKLYELYAVRWEIVPNGSPDKYVIRVGYDSQELDHIFEYGYEGGLLKVERQVQDDNIRNILIGRGGDKNLPFRYFKGYDEKNPSFPADPDWVYELANVYFDRLRSAEFRSYVQGWKYAHRNDYLIYNEAGDGVIGVKDNSRFVKREDTAVPWAWDKGYQDTKFNPVEYVKDDDSIRKYGELLGGLDDNEEIYPSIQGVELPGLGRIDQAVDVEQVKNDVPDIADAMVNGSNLTNITFGEVLGEPFSIGGKLVGNATKEVDLDVGQFVVPVGKYADIQNETIELDIVIYSNGTQSARDKLSLTSRAVAVQGGEEKPLESLGKGTYTLRIKATIENTADAGFTLKLIFKGASIRLYSLDVENAPKDDRTFDIWIKNIWETTPNENEDPVKYAHRVWDDILGNHLGNHLGEDAAVCFSTGWLSTSEDYQFRIVKFPVYDTTKALNGVYSHWRLTLKRSNADYDTLGKYVPNLERQGAPGDHFYFVGINLTQYYVEWAEKRLHDYKNNQLYKVSDITPSWVINFDKVRIDTPQFEDTLALIDQLHVGASIRLADKRFITDTAQGYLPLYLQSITYKFNEGNTANFTPDVEVTLGTEYVTTANPVAIIQGQVDILSQHMGATSTSNIQQIVRMVGDKIYLRKDGITDRSTSKTYFADLLASLGFRQGMVGGAGWGFFQDENGKWVLETDRVNVREEMQVNNLVINQIQARGGMIIESAASIEVSFVERTSSGYYRCYFDIKEGSIANLFETGDIAYCHRWNADNSELKYYKRRVQACGNDYIDLSDTNKDGNGEPSVGDVIVQYGNILKPERQFVIIRDVMGGGYERMLSGLNSVTAKGHEYFFAGYQSSTGERLFIGNDTNYLLYQGGTLTISGVLSIQTLIGDKPIDEYIKSFIPDIDLGDWEYLREALNNGETIGTGGLILTNLIMLGKGKVSDRTFQVYSGINGNPTNDASKGFGIAAWYGGDMLDKSNPPTPLPSNPRYAQSLFRFDGSGYLAGGNIYWDLNGAGGLAGGNIKFGEDGSLTLTSNIKIDGTGGETLGSIVSFLNNMDRYFYPVDDSGARTTWGASDVFAIKSAKGFFSDSFISAMGLNANTGEGGGGVYYLNELQDVNTRNLTTNDLLVWNGSRWVNIQPTEFSPISVLQKDVKEINDDINYTQANISHIAEWLGVALDEDWERWYNENLLSGILHNIATNVGMQSYDDIFSTSIVSQIKNTSDQIEKIKDKSDLIYEWVGRPSEDPGEWNEDTLYDQVQRTHTPINKVVFVENMSYRESGLMNWDNNRYIVCINLADNTIFLHDVGIGYNFLQWNDYEKWKPIHSTKGEGYNDALYICQDGSQIVKYFSYERKFKIVSGDLFYAKTPADLKLGVDNIGLLNGKKIANEEFDFIGYTKVFQLEKSDFILTLETRFFINETGFNYSDPNSIRVYACRLSNNVWSEWKQIRQDTIPT